jgi:hypothetical protein
LPVHGAVALALRGDTLEAILDDDGRAIVVGFPTGSLQGRGPAAREPATDPVARGLAIPCAVAGDWTFCPDRTGDVHRAPLGGGEGHVVANSRTGTRVAAGPIGEGHNVLVHLASRQSSEGWVSEAWAAVDDQSPVRLSEPGSGATSISLAPRGASLMALVVDARAALTAMHARILTYDHDLHLGEDVVVFVGGPGDRRTSGVLALPPSGPASALLPISQDVGNFGLAVVTLEDPPRVDEPVVWSLYPNGLDPAPVAVAVGRGRTWVARVRPRSAEPSAPRELELGELRPDRIFLPRALVPTDGSPSDVALALDSRGALWIGWLDAGGSWLERLVCR